MSVTDDMGNIGGVPAEQPKSFCLDVDKGRFSVLVDIIVCCNVPFAGAHRSSIFLVFGAATSLCSLGPSDA